MKFLVFLSRITVTLVVTVAALDAESSWRDATLLNLITRPRALVDIPSGGVGRPDPNDCYCGAN